MALQELKIFIFSWSPCNKFGFGTIVAWNGLFGDFQKSIDLEMDGENVKKLKFRKIPKSSCMLPQDSKFYILHDL